MLGMKKIQKTLSLVIAILVLVSSFLFISYSVKNRNHICSDNDCPICYELSILNDTLNNRNVVYNFALILLSLYQIYTVCVYNLIIKRRNLSLITLKVLNLN